MAIETFVWATPAGASGTPAFAVDAVKFGDGYQQTAPKGINSRSGTWTMTFTGAESYIKAIKDFIDRHGAARSFYWKPPLEDRGLYKGKYTSSHVGGSVYSLSVTMEQDFRP